MELVTPAYGLIFWTTIVFGILLFILRLVAWKPIIKSVNAREREIRDALAESKLAREEMAQLKSDNEKIIQQAKLERDEILKEARELKDKIIGEAKTNAEKQSAILLEQAKKNIEDEKAIVFNQLKNEMAQVSIEMAEKILGKELSDKTSQEKLVRTLLTELN
jgi:F-type H+-transporting ATPase subunit b